MNKLMKMATIVAGVGALLSFAGCGSKAPDQAAIEFLQTFASGKADMDYLKKNCADEKIVNEFVHMNKDGAAEKELEGVTFSIVKAKVYIKQTKGVETSNKLLPLDLVKVDGQWKVSAINKKF